MPNHTSEQSKRLALARAISQRRNEIIGRWLELVQQELRDRRIDAADLEDGLAGYLQGIASALEEPVTSVQQNGGALWIRVAQEHAATRVSLGFDISQLVQEFNILRGVLFDVARDEGLFSGEQAETIAEFISAAVRAAVQSYVDARDHEARRAEAEHVAFITHELRNPLTTALVAATELTGPESESRRREILVRSLHRIGELISNVLLTERYQAGDIKPQLVDTTLGQILSEVVATAQVKAREKGLSCVVSFDPNVQLRADPKLIGSAIFNLVDNAVKFTDRGQIEIAAESQLSAVVIHVRDSGPGISKGDLRTIFEPFHRGTTKVPGTGVGLAIARRAIEAQGGTLQVESTLGAGAHFWITLRGGRQDNERT
jgi:signal transduction histidine kinase